MKKILITLLVIIILAIAWLLLPEGWLPLKGCSDRQLAPTVLPLFEQGESALQKNDLTTARNCIEQGLREARDSDEYYRYEVLQSKYYFQTMRADSFLLCNRRLGQYLTHADGNTPEQQLLAVEYEMQLRVYEAKMVGRMDSALHHNLRALQLDEQLPFQSGNRLTLLTNLADVYKQLGQYDEGVRYFRRAMTLGDSLGMSDATRITLAIGIASAYASMSDFEQSKVWWQRAEELRPRMQRTEVFQYLNNRGNDYYLQGKYEESLLCFLQLDAVTEGEPNLEWERMFGRCNMGDIYIKLGRLEEARPLIEETERFFKREGQLLPLYYLTTQRIDLALAEGNTRRAMQIANENPTPEWMIPEQRLLREKALMRLYRQTARWKEYAEALKSADKLERSITDAGTRMRFSTALMTYEHEKLLLEKQRQIEEKELSFHWAIALLAAAAVVILLLLIIIALKQRQRKLKELEMHSRIISLRMENVRNRITPHFISNALTAEMLAQMDGKKVDLDPLVQLLHRGVELTGAEQTSLADELRFIAFYCNIESRSVGPDFCYQTQIAPNVDTERVMLPSMSVQILVENGIKHGLKRKPALPERQRTLLVRVSLRQRGTLVEVIDSGIGLPENTKIQEKTGLKVVNQTIQMLNEQHTARTGEKDPDCLMAYGLGNRTDGTQGCRGWLYLPDDFEYCLQQKNT